MSDVQPPGADMADAELPEDLLSAYADDELDASTRAEVEARLAESPEWRAILTEIREVRDAVRALPAVEPNPEFWARVTAADGASDAASDTPSENVVDLGAERRRRRVPRWAVAAAAAAVAAVFVLGVVVVPGQDRVRPGVAAFIDDHAARSSVGNDVISSLASVGVGTKVGR
jgi:anti-sigma factor RsiW